MSKLLTWVQITAYATSRAAETAMINREGRRDPLTQAAYPLRLQNPDALSASHSARASSASRRAQGPCCDTGEVHTEEPTMKEQDVFVLADRALDHVVQQIGDSQWDMDMPATFARRDTSTVPTLRTIIDRK